jgi:hypothetical protein
MHSRSRGMTMHARSEDADSKISRGLEALLRKELG